MTSLPILIVGGGIGGLATAVALHRLGVPVVVTERAPELREVGAGLTLWSNAVLALRRLGLEREIVDCSSTLPVVRTLTARGEWIGEQSFARLIATAGAPTLGAHRADLQTTLAHALPANVLQLGQTFVRADFHGDAVTAHYADGTSTRAALLIGADGLHSAVRSTLFGREPDRYCGYYAFRAIAPAADLNLDPEVTLFLLGAGAQVGVMPCGRGRVYWFATVNAPAGTAATLTNPHVTAQATFRDWAAPLPALLAAIPPAAVVAHDVIDRPPRWPWGRDRATLLGDAAHPTTPNLGQGACMALEDAVVLADAVRRCGATSQALREYERSRYARTAWVTRQSYRIGGVFQWQRPLLVKGRRWLLGTRFSEWQLERMLKSLLIVELPELVPLER